MINVMNPHLDAQPCTQQSERCVVWKVDEPETNTDMFIVIVTMTARSLTGTGTASLSDVTLRSVIMFSTNISYRS